MQYDSVSHKIVPLTHSVTGYVHISECPMTKYSLWGRYNAKGIMPFRGCLYWPTSDNREGLILLDFVRKSYWPSIYLITSTFESTQTDRPALALTLILPVHAHKQNRPAFPCNALKRGSIKVKARAGLSVCVLSNVDFIFQSKATWLSVKILIKTRTLSTDSAILIWILCKSFLWNYHYS